MRQYEVTFIVDPVLSSDEVKATVDTYQNLIKDAGAKIVHTENMGLRQLAYPINKRNTGVYHCIEFQTETGELISPMELSFRRDERVIRFLTVKLDKYGVKYNDDKRNGLIGKVKTKEEKSEEGKNEEKGRSERGGKKPKTLKKETPKAENSEESKES